MHRGPTVAWNFWKKSFHKDKSTKAMRTQLEKALPRLRVLLLACFPSSVLWLFSFCLVYSVSLRSAGSCAAAADGCSMRTVHSVPLLDTWEAASSRCKFKHTDRQRCPPESRGQTQRQRHTFTTSCLAPSLSGGVSRPEGSLWSSRFYYHSAACLHLSTYPLSVFQRSV